MRNAGAYFSSVARGYGRLLASLAGVALAALILALLSALIALPLWYLAIHTPRIFSWLVGAVVLLVLGASRIPALLRRGKTPAPRPSGRRLLRILQAVLMAASLYIGVGALSRGMPGAGIIFCAAALVLVGNLVRRAE